MSDVSTNLESADCMQPLDQCPAETLSAITTLFTDIDDTLTTNGQLPSAAYGAVERLSLAGFSVVPVTGRPAGWCDMIARFWPVDGVIGENGAFYFRYDRALRAMDRVYWQDAEERRANQQKLQKLQSEILAAVPGAAVSADQAYRESDLAIDFREDVTPLDRQSIDTIVRIFTDAGATAKVSSIHVNGWFGDFDKLSMTKRFIGDTQSADFSAANSRLMFVGDSPNDVPMFEAFENSVGVANVRKFTDRMTRLPNWITQKEGGEGFAELAQRLLTARSG